MTSTWTCGDPTCRFATDRHTQQDLDGTLRALPVRWGWLLAGLPAPAVAAVAPARRASDDAAAALDGDDLVHATEHALVDAGRALAAGGFLPSGDGRVAGLFTSKGGVPKAPVDAAVVGRRGVVGDIQRTRKHHGRVSQALCLWSAEVVAALAAEGHPIGPGSAGENVLVAGIDWPALRPGVRLRLGTVLAEVSGWALPCAKNAGWFADRDFHRIDPDRHPGWSRAYATVVEDGVLRVGDGVTVEP